MFSLALLLLAAAPPRELTELAAALAKTGGETRLEQVAADRWELSCDFPKKISDDALKPLHGVKGVIALRILGGGVTDAGLAHLKELPDLWLLVVNSKEVTDEGAQSVAKQLPNLTKLDFMRARLGKKGLTAVAGLKKLKELYLHAAVLTDKDLEPLKRCKALRRLTLPESVSEAALKELQKALPDAAVGRL